MSTLVTVPLALVHHRWVIPILAQLQRDRGARFAALRGHLGVSRDALTSTLTYLIELGLVRRNTGHGHPLRPEYLPTAKGRALAVPCEAVHGQLVDLDLRKIGLRKWSLPIVGAVSGVGAFSEIREHLADVTPRALSKGLADLAAADVIEHSEGRYRLLEPGRRLVPPLRDLELEARRARLTG